MAETVEQFAARLADRIEQFQARSSGKTLGNFLNAFKDELRMVVVEPPPEPPPPEPPPPDPPPLDSGFRWSVFDQKILAGATVDADSAAVVANLSTQQFMVQHLDYTTPVYYATASTPRVDVKGTQFASAGKTLTNVPLDPAWKPSPGGDLHLCVIDGDCEYDFWAMNVATKTCGTFSVTRVGATDGFQANAQRSGRNVLTAGLILKKEAEAGLIPHALTFACSFRHTTGWAAPCPIQSDSLGIQPGKIPNGARIRLDPTVNIEPPVSRNVSERAILKALQEYGAYLVDGGGFGFYAEAAVSAGPWRDFPSTGSWFLPSSLKSKLQVIEYGRIGSPVFSGPWNGPESCSKSPVV